MRRLHWFLSRLTNLFRPATRQSDVDADLEFPLEAEADERMAEGLAANEAQRAARRSLGNLALVREDTRDVWTWGSVDRTLQDLRYAARVLVRERSFTITA